MAGLLLFSACQNEEKTDLNALLLGRWELNYATRDGGPAPSVEGLYFTFLEDGALQTNIAGSPETAAYSIEDSVIKQRESRYEIDYNIEQLSDSTLIVSTKLRDYDFVFSLKKVVEEKE